MAVYKDRISDGEAVLIVDIIDQNGQLLHQGARAVIDTGASMTTILPWTAKQCGLTPYPSPNHPGIDEWCDFTFRHPVLGDFQVTALCKDLWHACQPSILLGQKELLKMIFTYDGVNTEFTLDRP